ncbi:MAG: LTA synthase family protein [Bacteroidales bacterium]|nr:LTA synthase family protein [Bacteroidales bacterium]
MKIESRRKLLKENLTLGIKRYLIINSIFFALLAIIRIFEYLYLNQITTLPKGSVLIELLGFGVDVLMLLNLAALFLLPFLILYLFYKPLANFVSGLLILFFVLAEIVLIKYFAATSLLLGSDLFEYKLSEVMEIASSGGGFSIITILLLIFIIGLITSTIIISKRIKPNLVFSLIFAGLSIVSLFFSKHAIPDAGKFYSEQNFNLATNKAYHFFRETYTYVFPPEKSEANLFPYFYTEGALSSGKSFEYISDEYPFLRVDNTPDLLGKYLTPGTENPNIVFIIVESLGRAYSGKGAYLESFTPFLDSLENHSLYWENALSTSSRTFEVLPSIFGSMPYGKSGFAELGIKMPDGMTLINLLKERGYISRFFYGGDANFDNMKMFLDKQNIDFVIDEKDFGNSYSKIPSTTNFTWGYGDKDIFTKGFEILANADSTPRLDIYLTIAMHDPYNIPDQNYYIRRTEEKFNEFKFDDLRKAEYRKYIKNFSTILYFDDALRYFFKEYRKRKDFNNTIFIITGDHRMSSPPISTQIDRFHVPLIIYSPMLNETAKFSSVVSHLDITPSVIAFLRNNYTMAFPSTAPWLGQGLDSVAYFRNTISMPFIRTKNETTDYLDQDFFMVKDQLYMISDNLGLNRIKDEQKLQEIQRKFEKFKTDNINVITNNKLVPDSLKSQLWK